MTIDNRPADESLRRMQLNWPEAVTPVSRLMLRLFRLNKIIQANAERCVQAEGLDFTEFQLLVMLRREPPPHELPPTELYQHLQMSSGGITKALKRLENSAFVERGVCETDRRSKPVRLTAKGCGAIERAMADVLSSDGDLLRHGLNAEELEQMITLLQRLMSAVDERDRSASG
ncbi:MAG: MarR family transcriptional regulator [Pseudomonadota bacterium]